MFDCHRYAKCPNVEFCFVSAISVCSWLLGIWTDTINCPRVPARDGSEGEIIIA